MQNKSKKAKPVEIVQKPIIRGSSHGKDAWKLALRRMVAMLAVTIIYLISGMMLAFDGIWGRVFSCVFTVFVTAYYLYGSGVAKGQTDAAFGEILYDRQQSGHAVPEEDRQRSFHPLKGLFAVLVGAIPFVVFAVVFAVLTEKSTYQLGGLPAWASSLMEQSEFGDALRYYEVQAGMTALDIMRIIDRAMIMPFINLAAYFGNDATLVAERLSPVLVLIAPLGYALGYSQGLLYRTRINTGIKMGDDKKKRRERKARQKRQQSKAPERLI